MSSRDSLTSWVEGASLALVGNNSIDGVAIKMPYGRMDNRNLNFFKKNSVVAQFKALNKRISELAYILNLEKRLQR